jgi:1,2-phenylacetyl-CoA epoxidase catalytic subunit
VSDNLNDTALGLIDGLTKKTAKDRRRDRWMIYSLAVSIAIDITLTIIFAFLVNSVHVQQIQTCLDSNKQKLAVIKIWEINIDTFHNNAAGNNFLNEVKQTYAPIKCP